MSSIKRLLIDWLISEDIITESPRD